MSNRSERQAKIERITGTGIDLVEIKYSDRGKHNLSRTDYILGVLPERLLYGAIHILIPHEIPHQND